MRKLHIINLEENFFINLETSSGSLLRNVADFASQVLKEKDVLNEMKLNKTFTHSVTQPRQIFQFGLKIKLAHNCLMY